MALPFYDVLVQLRNWAGIVGLMWTAFKGVDYVKSIKGNDLVHIQKGVEALHREFIEQTGSLIKSHETVGENIIKSHEEQTRATVGELKELRTDIRTIITSLITPVSVYQPRAARAKKK